MKAYRTQYGNISLTKAKLIHTKTVLNLLKTRYIPSEISHFNTTRHEKSVP